MRDILHKYYLWYFKIVSNYVWQFWNITSGIYAKYHIQIMFLPIPVLVCASIVVLRAINFIFQQSDVRRCMNIVHWLSLFVWKCNLYSLQIKERNSLFHVFSWWDGAKRCVQLGKKTKQNKTKKRQMGGFVPSPLLPLYFFPPFNFTSHSIRDRFRFEDENEYEYEN